MLKWNVKVGDKVSAGDVICEIQTDKSAVGYEVQDDGFIAQILVNEGADNIDVGKPIAVVTRKKDQVAAFQTFTASSVGTVAGQPAPAQATAATTDTSTQTQSPAQMTSTQRSGDRIIVTPYAKKIASEKGVDLASVAGSGPNGRIKAADVLNAKPAPARPQAAPVSTQQQQQQPVEGEGFTDIPLTQMRKVIGQRLTESKQNLPHYYVTMEIKMDKLLK